MESKKITILRVAHQMLWISTLGYCLECLFYRENVSLVWTKMWYLLPLIALSFFWYELSRRFWIFLLAQPLIFMAFVSVGRGYEFGYVLAFFVGFILQLLEKKYRDFSIMNPNWAMCGVLAALYLLCLMTDRGQALDIIPYALMLYIVVAILFMNEIGMAEFMHMRQNVKNVQYGQVKKGNQIFILGVIGLAGILFVIASLFLDNSPIYWFLGKLRDGLKAFINLLEGTNWGEKEVVRETMEDFSDERLNNNGNILDDLSEGKDLPQALYYIVGTVLAIFLTILLIRGLVRLVMLLVDRFKVVKKEEIVEEEIIQDEVISLRPRTRKRFGRQAKTKDERVRKIYRKTILKARKNKGMDYPDISYTPFELENESLGEETFEKRVILHSVYEKARYSQTGVTEAEEREIKGII